jgi:hypothetical protein
MIVSELKMLRMIRRANKIFLLEPLFNGRKYPPLGLSKISTYAKSHGAEITFGHSYNRKKHDLVCISSVFSYDAIMIKRLISSVRFYDKNVKILIGGIHATLLKQKVDSVFCGDKIFVYQGLSPRLDDCLPDYSIDWKSDPMWDDYGFVFTSRGCPNKCGYCAVWRIEPELYIVPNWKKQISECPKDTIMIMDNNLAYFSEEHFIEVCEYCVGKNKRVLFEGGVDCKQLTKEKANVLAKLKKPKNKTTCIRIAFDRIKEDGVFQRSLKMLLDAGIKSNYIAAYCLFNFSDTPQEADYRCQVCTDFNIRPYAQPYKPLNHSKRNKPYIGKHWTPQLLRAFRAWWLIKGMPYNYKTHNVSFEEFAKSREMQKSFGANPYKLTREDWRKWYFQKGKYDRLRERRKADGTNIR